MANDSSSLSPSFPPSRKASQPELAGERGKPNRNNKKAKEIEFSIRILGQGRVAREVNSIEKAKEMEFLIPRGLRQYRQVQSKTQKKWNSHLQILIRGTKSKIHNVCKLSSSKIFRYPDSNSAEKYAKRVYNYHRNCKKVKKETYTHFYANFINFLSLAIGS